MRVSLLHYSAPPVVGGVEGVLAHQARVLAELGHAVRILAGRGEQTLPNVPFVHLPLADSRHARVSQVKAQLDLGQVEPAFAALRDELNAALRAALAEADVLIAHNVCSLHKNLALTAALYDLFCAARPAGFSARLVIWHHDLAWATPRYRAELHEGYPWALLRAPWPGATHVVVSEQRRAELAGLTGLSPNAIKVIPNGLDIARFHKLEAQTQALVQRMRLMEADAILLLPVRLTPRKNIELALHTLAALRSHFRRPVLIVTGPLGPHNPANLRYFQSLKALRAELGLEDAAYFLAEWSDHFLPDAVIADFYRLADALFFPSREEGFGLPMLEAAASRLPIFCSDIAPLRALGDGEACFFSPDEDPRRLAELIAGQLSESAAFRAAVRVRSRYSWEQIGAHYIEPLLMQTLEER
ncbi:MAG: glycosyltransferase [Chloroflexi bacterium]|jgi:mannosylglucosylglycerate synthase|nr:glycosyltransferase [Chloroflexota bacterium]